MTLASATAAPQAPQVRPHDVLVVGAGGAGLRAAIEAKAAGADVVHRQYRIVRPERPAAVYHLLRAALQFRIAALH